MKRSLSRAFLLEQTFLRGSRKTCRAKHKERAGSSLFLSGEHSVGKRRTTRIKTMPMKSERRTPQITPNQIYHEIYRPDRIICLDPNEERGWNGPVNPFFASTPALLCSTLSSCHTLSPPIGRLGEERSSRPSNWMSGSVLAG